MLPRRVAEGGRDGMVRHFFPWWMERRYRAVAVEETSLTEKERDLIARKRLDREQIGYRRQMRANFRGLARQEYAEDEESCFLASGDSVFELAAIEARLAEMQEPAERRRNGELEIWLPPLKGKEYLVAADPAGGGSEGDYSAAQVLEMETGLQCAEFSGHVGGLELARLVTELAASTTRRGWWWRETTTAVACWRWQRRRANTRGFTSKGPGRLVDHELEPPSRARATGRGPGAGAGAVSKP